MEFDNYNITYFDCCLKNIDVAVGGVCNEYLVNGESSTSEGYQQMSIIKIFLGFKHHSLL